MIKETLVLAALAISSPAVVDGDTVRIAGVSIRLTDYDAPELFSPKCVRVNMSWHGRQRSNSNGIISRVKLELVPCATSNYGRLCAEGTIEGKPLATHMIGLGLASPYVCWPGHCQAKRNWC